MRSLLVRISVNLPYRMARCRKRLAGPLFIHNGHCGVDGGAVVRLSVIRILCRQLGNDMENFLLVMIEGKTENGRHLAAAGTPVNRVPGS